MNGDLNLEYKFLIKKKKKNDSNGRFITLEDTFSDVQFLIINVYLSNNFSFEQFLKPSTTW